jgi:hypothetical protein
MARSLKKFREANAIYSKLPCEAHNCPLNRDGVGRYCRNHQLKLSQYGSPQGYPIYREQYAEELKEVGQLFTLYPNHPGLLSVTKWLDDLIESAGSGEPQAGSRILERVRVKRIHGIAGLDTVSLITELCAVFLYSRRYPMRLDDGLPLTCALGRNFARMATWEKKFYGVSKTKATKFASGVDIKALGEKFRQVLSRFFITVEQGVQHQKQQRTDWVNSLAVPFE